MNLSDLIARLEAIEDSFTRRSTKSVFVAGAPNMPVVDVIETPTQVILWASLAEEEEDSLLTIDVMQDESGQWRLVVYDKFNKRTMMIGRSYNDFLVAEYMASTLVENIDDFIVAFAKGIDEANQFLNKLENV